MARNMSLQLAHSPGPGKSVSVKATNDRATSTLQVGCQASLTGCREAHLRVEASVSGLPGAWWAVGDFLVTEDGDKLAVFTSDIPATFLRAHLLEEIEPLVPVTTAPPKPIETVEIDQGSDGSSIVTTVLQTPAPAPVAPFGVSCWLSAV